MAERVRELAAGYEPPSFSHVPDPDAAIFLCAIDHRTGYQRPAPRSAGRGRSRAARCSGRWGCAGGARAARPADRRRPRRRDARARRRDVPDRRRDRRRSASAARRCGATSPPGLERDHGGRPRRCSPPPAAGLAAPAGCSRCWRAIEAYADPLDKKAFLFAKICARRGWLEVDDPESWEVCADNVLMRLALRSGLVEPGARRRGACGDPRRVQAGGRGGRVSSRRCSTTCSGSSAAATPTCSAPTAAISTSRPGRRAPGLLASPRMRIPAHWSTRSSPTPARTRPTSAAAWSAAATARRDPVYRARNAEASPLRYDARPQDQFRIMKRDRRARRGARGDLPLAHRRARPSPRRPTSTSPSAGPTRST